MRCTLLLIKVMCVSDTIIKRVSRVMTKKIIEALYLKRDKRMSRINKFAVLKYCFLFMPELQCFDGLAESLMCFKLTEFLW